MAVAAIDGGAPELVKATVVPNGFMAGGLGFSPDGKWLPETETTADPATQLANHRIALLDVSTNADKPAKYIPKWKKEALEKWGTLDPLVQSEVERREQDFHKGIEGYKQKAQVFDQWDEAFRQGLRAHGYVEGRNLVLVHTFVDENYELFGARARELLDRKVDLILASVAPAAVA